MHFIFKCVLFHSVKPYVAQYLGKVEKNRGGQKMVDCCGLERLF